MNGSEQIKLLKQIWEATKDIKIINEKLNDFDERLKKIEEKNVWEAKGIRFMNDHGQKVVEIVGIFSKEYGNSEKISGYDLIKNVLNSFAKSAERKRIIFISIMNSLAFRFIEVICVMFLIIYFVLKIYCKI